MSLGKSTAPGLREPAAVDVTPLQTSAPDGAAGREWRRRLSAGLDGPLRLVPVLIALLAIWVFFEAEDSVFLSSRNLTNLANQIAVTTILGLGLMLVLIVRQIDLSLAALAAVCGVIAARLAVLSGLPVEVAVAVALLAGCTAGAIQGLIVTVFRAPSFIVTLGGYFVCSGLVLVLLPVTQVISLANTPLQDIASTSLPAGASYIVAAAVVAAFALVRWTYVRDAHRMQMTVNPVTQVVAPTVALAALVFAVVAVFNSYQGVPTPTVVVAGLMAILAYISSHTPLGKHLYAVGGNPEAARRAGIPVAKLTVITFAVGGLLTATAGLVAASRDLGVSGQSVDLTLLFGAVSAAVIGGVSLFGGRGSVWGVLVGSLVIGSISNGLLLLNSSTQVIYIAQGGILVAAVVIDAVVARTGPSRARA
jgi:D-xylose transport system permease protein